jgi:O-antigen ligase|tara:strand:+ start:290 stop:1498 length:1209 start_codon:yes stop_codon:yes gene_type:complete
MRIKNIFSFLFLLAACAELAIGRVYDERLSIYGINLSLIISFFFFLTAVLLLSSIKKIILTRSKIILFGFFILLLIVNPILWLVYGVYEYGFFKFLNFILIAIPISIIITEKFKYQDVKNIFLILLGVVFLLLFFALTGLFETPRPDGRISILGGGPIIFGRWMGFGVLALFFLPFKKMYLPRLCFILIFIIYCLVSGSRGPFISLLLIFTLYFFLNFRKIFSRLSVLVLLLLAVFFGTNISNNISELGRTDRVFLNVAKRGGSNQSTQTRYELVDRSYELMKKHPFGIGAGNWQLKANQLDPTHLMAHEYPHNLLFEIINEYGLLAGILLLILIFHVTYTSFAKMINHYNSSSSLYPFLFYLWIFLLFNAMLSGSLNDSRLLFVTASCILIINPLILKDSE